MSINIDPIRIIKEYISGKREKKKLDELLNKHYNIEVGNKNIVGKFLSFSKMGNDLLFIIETDGEKIQIPFNTVKSLKEIREVEYDFPQKLNDLISISSKRSHTRPAYLDWLLASAKPTRINAKKWFNDEIFQIEQQINILIHLFPHRKYQTLSEMASEIRKNFESAIKELDQVIMLVQEKKVTRISDIYSKPPEYANKDESPDILAAFIGIFEAGLELDALVENVESIIANVQDTVTITNILSQFR